MPTNDPTSNSRVEIRSEANVPVSPACQKYLDQKAQLEAARRDVWEDLKQAILDGDIREKQRLARLASELARAIVAVQAAYVQCEIREQQLKPLNADFRGTAKATLDMPFPIPDVEQEGAVTIPLYFDPRRTQVAITTFPAITFNQPLVNGSIDLKNDSAVGRYYSSGDIDLPVIFVVSLYNDPSDISVSELPLHLTTARPDGAPVDAGGSTTLHGSGKFSGGRLDGYDCAMTLAGVISPHP